MTATISDLTVLELEAIVNNEPRDVIDRADERLGSCIERADALDELKRRASDPANDEAVRLEGRAAAGALERLDAREVKPAPPTVGEEYVAPAPISTDDLTEDAPPELEAGALERILEGRGYIAVRGDLLRCAQAIMETERNTIDAVLRYAENALASAKAQGATSAHLEAIGNELVTFKAIKRFHRDLHALEDKAQARAVLLGQGGAASPAAGPARGPGR